MRPLGSAFGRSRSSVGHGEPETPRQSTIQRRTTRRHLDIPHTEPSHRPTAPAPERRERERQRGQRNRKQGPSLRRWRKAFERGRTWYEACPSRPRPPELAWGRSPWSTPRASEHGGGNGAGREASGSHDDDGDGHSAQPCRSRPRPWRETRPLGRACCQSNNITGGFRLVLRS